MSDILPPELFVTLSWVCLLKVITQLPSQIAERNLLKGLPSEQCRLQSR